MVLLFCGCQAWLMSLVVYCLYQITSHSRTTATKVVICLILIWAHCLRATSLYELELSLYLGLLRRVILDCFVVFLVSSKKLVDLTISLVEIQIAGSTIIDCYLIRSGLFIFERLKMLECCGSLLHVGNIFILIICTFLLHADALSKDLVFLTFGTPYRTRMADIIIRKPFLVQGRIQRKGMIDKSIAMELASSTFSRIIIVQIQILAFWTPPGRLDTGLRNWQVESHQFVLCWIRWH